MAVVQETLAQRIREARAAAGLSREALARRVGVTLRTAARWEDGDTMPSYERLADVAAVLNRPISFFVDGGPEA